VAGTAHPFMPLACLQVQQLETRLVFFVHAVCLARGHAVGRSACWLAHVPWPGAASVKPGRGNWYNTPHRRPVALRCWRATRSSACPSPLKTTSTRPAHHRVVHPGGTGVLKKGLQAIGQCRGEWNTMTHMVAADARTAATFSLSPGQAHDASKASRACSGASRATPHLLSLREAGRSVHRLRQTSCSSRKGVVVLLSRHQRT
jgi:hypothetical protein